MRKEISALNENKVIMQTKVPNLRDGEKHIVLTVTDVDKNIQRMLEYIKALADMGHSFNIEVDPTDSEFHKSFSIDGDGTDSIGDITIESLDA